MKYLRDYPFDIDDNVRVVGDSILLPGESGKVTGFSFSGLVQVQTQRRKKPYYFLTTELIKESPK